MCPAGNEGKNLNLTVHLSIEKTFFVNGRDYTFYQLGFEHPQSFSKLFKTKVNLSPLSFRQSFN